VGDYSKTNFSFKLRKDAPEVVKAYLALLINDPSDDWKSTQALKYALGDHQLFKTDRWYCVFANFLGETDAYKTVNSDQLIFDVVGYIKNYGGLLREFADWIKPFLDESYTNFIASQPDEIMYDGGDPPITFYVGDESMSDLLSKVDR